MAWITEPRIQRILQNHIKTYVDAALAHGFTKEEIQEVITNAYKKIRYGWNNPRFNRLTDKDILRQEHLKIVNRRKNNGREGNDTGEQADEGNIR